MTPLLEAVGVVKTFPGVRALDGVDFELRAGEVHALLGENGAGKSTLMRILAGDHVPDAGELRFDGRPVRLASPADAIAHGVRLVAQERALVPTLSVGENVLLGRLPRRRGRVDWGAVRAQAAELLARVGLDVDPATELGLLRRDEQQLVEVAKALSDEGRILILDEATASLSTSESERLFDVVRGLRAHGVGIVYITHRVGELASVADRVTVLRDGRNVLTAPLAETSHEGLVEQMVGRRLADLYPRARPEPGEVRLRVDGLSADGVCSDVSLEVRAGEIVALFGLVGSGATEIPYAIAGDVSARGVVEVRGRVGLVPADRRSEGLFPQGTVGRNIGAATLGRYGPAGIYLRGRETAAARRQIAALDLRPPRPWAPVAKLSGGNQQKAVLGRWLERGADVLLLSEPTRGVDVGARAEIYRLLGDLCAGGRSVLLASSDLDEVVGLADRVHVVSRGRVVSVLAGDEVRHDRVLEVATR
ncbi:MAG: sugar ABC transporter ATP-binding protein [Solirubrobacteraceae bacterium]|nr:sugar ABC transporter ATP-binding protein [Solirubrobacteraceae bacterium]